MRTAVAVACAVLTQRHVKISVPEVARLLSVSEDAVFGWIRKGSIPVTRVQEQYRFNRSEILEWATARGMPVSVELFPERDDREPLRLSDALEAGGIHYDLAGADREQVLRSLVRVMALPEDVDRETLLEFHLAREALGSTGVGDGIAIPHVRSPVVLHVPRPMVALCFLRQPIDFRAIDGRPVDTLFSVVATTTRTHLQLLARLSLALHDTALRQLVRRRAPRDELFAGIRRVEAGFQPPGDRQKASR